METVTPRKIDDNPAMTVLDAIADRAGKEVSDLRTPLYSAIDPDALDTLVESGASVSVSFQYEDYLVTVQNDDCLNVDVEPAGGESV